MAPDATHEAPTRRMKRRGPKRKHFLPRAHVAVHFADSDIIALKILARSVGRSCAALVRQAALDRLRPSMELAKTWPDFEEYRRLHVKKAW